MPRFMVERYLPDAQPEDLRTIVEQVSAVALPAGVRLVRSVIALTDQAIFCEFEAPDEDAVRRANAGLPFERIVPVELHRAHT